MTSPDERLCFKYDKLLLAGRYSKVINYASFHCGLPFLQAITVSNTGKTKSGTLDLKFAVEDYCETSTISIPQIEAGEIIEMMPPQVHFNINALKRQEKPVKVRLMAVIQKQAVKEAVGDVTILGFWNWACDASPIETTAAFSAPLNPTVQHITAEAECFVSGDDNTERTNLQAIYTYLLNNRQIEYEYPRIHYLESGRLHYQVIKPPHEFADGLKTGGGRKATCMDLALFFSACLENIGLLPVIILTGSCENVPLHAFIGCWAGSVPGGQPVIRDIGFLRTEVEASNLFMVECTGICRSFPGGRGALSFEDAVNSAVRQLLDTEWACAIDMAACRPPYGTITPMDCPVEPAVARVYLRARELAKRKKCKSIGISFIFYGLFGCEGEAAELLEQSGYDSAAICSKFDKYIPQGNYYGEPSATLNFEECIRLAGEYAVQRRSPTVSEQDLWWALIHKSGSSRNLQDMCRVCGVDLGSVCELLVKHYTRPELNITVSSSSGGKAAYQGGEL